MQLSNRFTALRFPLIAALVVIAQAASFARPNVADARASWDFPYQRERVWNASLRLVRVDLGCTLGERDTDAGYFLFEYRDGARTYPASIELLPASVEGREGVRVVVKVPALPSYVERMILERLRRKLYEDYGDPPPAPPRRPTAPAEAPPSDAPAGTENRGNPTSGPTAPEDN